MDGCGQYLKSEFPLINDDLYEYVEGVLTNGIDDFEDSDELYEAVGAVLHEVADEKTEDDIREICGKLLDLLRGTNGEASKEIHKVLDAPVHLGSMAANLQDNVEDIKSIWVMQRDETLKVDARKLEKAEQKLQQKQEKRQEFATTNKAAPPVRLQSATASQPRLIACAGLPFFRTHKAAG